MIKNGYLLVFQQVVNKLSINLKNYFLIAVLKSIK